MPCLNGWMNEMFLFVQLNECQYDDSNYDWLLFVHLNEYEWIWSMLYSSLDWVVYPIRGMGFLFGCKNFCFSIDRL